MRFGRPFNGRLTPSRAWVLAILLFGVADVAVTVIALHGFAPESHFAYLAVLNLFAVLRPLGFLAQLLAALVTWKIVAILLLFGLYRIAPQRHRVGVPIGLAVWGAVVLLWNLYAMGTFHRLVL